MSELPYSASAETPETSPASFRLISCNLQYGTPSAGWDKKKGSMTLRGFASNPSHARNFLLEAAQQLKEYRPDILLLQEVDMHQLRSGKLNQAEFLAEALEMSYWEYAPTYSGHIVGIHYKPQSLLAPTQRGYGLALLSRFPIQRSLSLSLPGRKSIKKQPSPMDSSAGIFQRGTSYVEKAWQYWKNVIKNQPRIVQGALIDTPLGTLALGNTHLETHSEVAKRQARLAWQSLHTLEADAYLLAGDFNLSPKTVDTALEELDRTERPTSHHSACTFPAWKPRHHIDQFLLHGLNVQGEPQTQRLSISDHLAVICDLSL